MISIVENNPYRILGSYSDSKLIDIIANANKIKAFAKVGRTVPFEIDNISGFSVLPERTVESVDAALALIQSDTEKFKYSIFWFNKSGVDFGTADLINGNIKVAGSKFISAIESNNIISIQDIIGDKAKNISSSDLLNCYIGVMKENGCLEETIIGCLNTARFEQHISIISALQKSGLSDELKKKADSISELTIENPSSAFASIKRIINEVKQLVVGKNLSGDIALSSTYDQFCKTVRSKVISISNNAFDNIGKTEKANFIAILNSCLEILKSIDTSSASTVTTAKYKEDIDTMIRNIKEADDTYLIAIASNEDICWHCGNKATQTKEKKYEKKEERIVGFNRKQVTTYTKTVTFHICDECAKEEETASRWNMCGLIFVILVELGVAIYLAGDQGWGWEYSWDWFWPLVLGNFLGGFLLTMWVGFGIGWMARRIFARKGIRKFIRSESDHPLVKRIESEGFS